MGNFNEHLYYLMRRHGFEDIEQCKLFEFFLVKVRDYGYSLSDATKIAKYMVKNGTSFSEAKEAMLSGLSDSGKVLSFGFEKYKCRNVIAWLKKRGLDINENNIRVYRRETISIKEMLEEYGITDPREAQVNYDRILRYASEHKGKFHNNVDLVDSYMDKLGNNDAYKIRMIRLVDKSIDYDTAAKILRFSDRVKSNNPVEWVRQYRESCLAAEIKQKTLYTQIVDLGYDKDDARRIAEAARRKGNTTDVVEALSNYKRTHSCQQFKN